MSPMSRSAPDGSTSSPEIACRDEAELLAIVDNDIRPLDGVMSIEVSIYQHLHYKRLTPTARP